MTTTTELTLETRNRRIAEWCGFKRKYTHCDCSVCCDYLVHSDGLDKLPKFYSDLNALFKYVVPKVKSIIDFDGVEFIWTKENILAYINYWNHTGNEVNDNYQDSYDGKGDTPAMALFCAVEKLIEENQSYRKE